jgi:ComF family protein
MLEAWQKLFQQLFPESCPRCGAEWAGGFCPQCRRIFTRIETPCRYCAMPGPCRRCPISGPNWAVDQIRAPFAYGPPLAGYLWALKYRAERHLGRALGSLVAETIDTTKIEIDAVVGVPLHPRRLRLRGFNQADEIAGPIARKLDRPLFSPGFNRIISTRPQTELDRNARLRAPLGKFAVSRDLGGLRIAIVDDVITTGATVNAFAAALKAEGAAYVEAWSVARSVGRKANALYSTRNI